MTVWEFVSKDQNTAIVEIFTLKGTPDSANESIVLKGLDPAAVYVERYTGRRYTGEALMYIGLKRTRPRDFRSELLILERTVVNTKAAGACQ